mmetsp:Transcript_2456/g.5344  ORF Transcript_2456/g.5344 Transcript_2456/m.5344 type:complete len:159 (-) Transcript_2456:59-535(-)
MIAMAKSLMLFTKLLKLALSKRLQIDRVVSSCWGQVSKFLRESKVGVVIWLRRNPLDRFISFLRESKTGKPHCQAKVGCDIQKVRELTFLVPLGEMVAFLDTAARSDAEAARMLRDLGRPVLTVSYEALIGEQSVARAWWATILQFIGISSQLRLGDS